MREEIDRFDRRQQQAMRARTRRKRISELIWSFIFAGCVFGIVGNALIENIRIENSAQTVFAIETDDGDSPMASSRSRKDDFLNVLVAVTDEDELRTDALLLVSYDKDTNIVNIMNIPRDTYTDATTLNKKITAAYINGIEHTMDVVADLTGVMADNYVVVNFDGLVTIIDEIGGVEINVPFRMKYDDPTQDLHIDLKAGLQTLNGKDSVDYLRWRKNNSGISPSGYITGDLGRIEALQGYIESAKSQLFKFSTLLKIPSITSIIFENIETDLSFSEILWLGKNCISIDEIYSTTLPGIDAYIKGVSYYLPQEQGILDLINDGFNPYLKEITELNLYEGD